MIVFSVQKSVEILSRAKRPVIIVGSQATLPPVPVEELRAALEVSIYNYYESLDKCNDKNHLSVIYRPLL